MGFDVYLEVGKKRVFAGALEWAGWCRGGRDPDEALATLAEYGPRYAEAIRSARAGFKAPPGTEPLKVVERLKGNATTDFGAPGIPPRADERPLDAVELKRQTGILRACWATFDSVAKAHAKTKLATGPRGGGRSVAKIVAHVLEADVAYLSRLGGRHERGSAASEMKRMRAEFLEMLASRTRGEEPDMGRRTAPLWTPRFAIRRSAWHALDHAWEIEDRS
jgi:DinB family protein